MDLLLILGIFISGFFFGWLRASKVFLDKLLSDPDFMISLIKKYKESKEDIKDSDGIREIEIERHGEMLYLYAKDNGEFLAQGNTLQEALGIVEQRFPDQTFKGNLSKDEADALGISVK